MSTGAMVLHSAHCRHLRSAPRMVRPVLARHRMGLGQVPITMARWGRHPTTRANASEIRPRHRLMHGLSYPHYLPRRRRQRLRRSQLRSKHHWHWRQHQVLLRPPSVQHSTWCHRDIHQSQSRCQECHNHNRLSREHNCRCRCRWRCRFRCRCR